MLIFFHVANFVTVSEADGAKNVEEIIYTMQSLKPILNDVFCYLEQGWRFHGRVRDVSKSGKVGTNNRPKKEILVPDWLINSHVT